MNRRYRIFVVLIVQLILLGVELGTTYDDFGRQIALALTNVGTTAFVLWLDARFRRRGLALSNFTICITLAAVWIDALGNFQNLYGQWWWWDRVTHTIGGMAVTALFIDWALVRRQAKKLLIPHPYAILFGFLLGQFVGAMYEVTEWLGDWWFATERVRGPYDAPRDLFFNLLGGLIVWAIFRAKSKPA